jgi:hypothetical protein
LLLEGQGGEAEPLHLMRVRTLGLRITLRQEGQNVRGCIKAELHHLHLFHPDDLDELPIIAVGRVQELLNLTTRTNQNVYRNHA